MSGKTKKILALILFVVLIFSNVQIVGAVADEFVPYALEYPVLYPNNDVFSYPELMKSSGPNVETLEQKVDIDSFREHLIKYFAECPTFVDISEFKIPNTTANWTAIKNYIWYETPELFQVRGLGYAASGGYISAIYASYNYTAVQYSVMYQEFLSGANKLLDGIKDNDKLDDVEKALLLHDRIAISCKYTQGTIPQTSYNAYGVFALQDAVCMGYALAYDYLLRQVGIDSYYCSSSLLNHAWNIVYIDGEKYHVDVTWDDPTYDRSGRVRHVNFLRSTTGISDTGHIKDNTIDYDTTPTSTKYDNYYWQNSNTAFQLVGDDIYYIDNTAKTLNKISDGVTTTCKNINARWWATSNSYWTGHYCALATDGKDLFYSMPEAVYKYDVSTGTSTIVFEPDLSAGSYYYIYGFKYEDCKLICEVFNTPNFQSDTVAKNTQTTEYHTASDSWIIAKGSSSSETGSKHKECINCGYITDIVILPLVAINIQNIATADYTSRVIFTDEFVCNNISNLITCSGATTISATPSYNANSEKLYGTGSSVAIFNGTEYVYALTVIVNGDVNGDSVCDILDVAQTEKYSNQNYTPTINEIYAANGAVSDTIDTNTYQNIVNIALSAE